MKKAVILIIILFLISIAYFLKDPILKNLGYVSPTPPPTINYNDASFCTPKDLSARLTTEGAAGSIYGILTIKNTSERTCLIFGNNFIVPISEAKNITIKNQGQAGADIVSLTPNKEFYSQIHYPNGPQCSGQTIQEVISYRYKISQSDFVTFKNQNGDIYLRIGVCRIPSEMTEVDVWGLSEKSVNQ